MLEALEALFTLGCSPSGAARTKGPQLLIDTGAPPLNVCACSSALVACARTAAAMAAQQQQQQQQQQQHS
eukprot:10974922-Alexandrium_andersonii.AAC.1